MCPNYSVLGWSWWELFNDTQHDLFMCTMCCAQRCAELCTLGSKTALCACQFWILKKHRNMVTLLKLESRQHKLSIDVYNIGVLYMYLCMHTMSNSPKMTNLAKFCWYWHSMHAQIHVQNAYIIYIIAKLLVRAFQWYPTWPIYEYCVVCTDCAHKVNV